MRFQCFSSAVMLAISKLVETGLLVKRYSTIYMSNGFKLSAHDYGVMRHAKGLERTNKRQEFLEVLQSNLTS